MKTIYVTLTALTLGIVMLMLSKFTLQEAQGDGFYTTIYEVSFYEIGGETVVVEELVGCAGPSGDCIMVTVTAKRIKSA